MIVSTKINIDLYSTHLLFVIADDIYEASQKLVKHVQKDEVWTAEYAGSVHGVTIYGTNPDYSILIRTKSLTYNTIVHELYHVANAMMEKISIDNEEATAWLIGYLAEKIFKFLESKQITVAHG